MDYSLVQKFDGKQDSISVSRTALRFIQGGNRESERLKIIIPISIGFVNHQQLDRPSENSITEWAFDMLLRCWHHILVPVMPHQGSALQYKPDPHQDQCRTTTADNP
jgi:hypothetical protein